MINPEFCPSGPDAGNITVSDVEEDEEPENDQQTIFTVKNIIWLLIYIIASTQLFTFDFFGFICNPLKFIRDEEERMKRQLLQSLNNSDSDIADDADTVKPDPEADSGSENTINEVEEPADHKKNV